MSKVINQEVDSLLEETSRSFYLTLRALPSGVRPQVGLLYLLARTSDTIADSEQGSTAGRLAALEQYNERIQGRSDKLPDLTELARLQGNPAEARLLDGVAASVLCLDDFPAVDQQHIRRCLDIIISGQSLDLERFSDAGGDAIVALASDEELDDYAYRVAGSVGEFWTHLTLEHMFDAGEEESARLFETGVRFGKALQLINILRDLPEDLRMGRCYIPGPALAEHGLPPESLLDAQNMERFRPLFDQWIDVADGHVAAAVEYIGLLPSNQLRLRGACMLPVLIGQRTLTLLREGNVLDAENRIKVTRPEIKALRNKTLLAVTSRKRSLKLLGANPNT